MKYQQLQQQFKSQGYVLVKGFFSQAEIDDLMAKLQQASKAREEDILDKGNLKFHSRLFEHSQPLQEFIAQPKVVDFLKGFIGPDFWVRWDQAVEKKPGADTFPWHQDNAYSTVKDPHFQFWISTTKMTAENGGLWVKPGSHKRSLPHHQVDNHMVYKGNVENPVFISAEPGDIVLFSSYTLHSTTPNITQASRWAYVVEYMSLHALDLSVKPPYLVIARGGKPNLEWVDSYPGMNNMFGYLKYADVKGKAKSLVKGMVAGLKSK